MRDCSRNYFFEALKAEFNLKDIRKVSSSHVRPIKYHGIKDKVVCPPCVEWTFDGENWFGYVPTPEFRNEVQTTTFFGEIHYTEVSYDPNELIKVIEMSKENTADEINLKLHGRIRPLDRLVDDGYDHVYR
jgi:hypothetical protein